MSAMVGGDASCEDGTLAGELYVELDEVPNPGAEGVTADQFRRELCAAFGQAIARHANATVDTSGGLITDDATITGDLGVVGASLFQGVVTIDDTLHVDAIEAGPTTVGAFEVTGDATIEDDLTVTGDATIGGSFEAGATTVASLSVTGDATVGDDLTVTGDASVGGTFTVTGAVTGASMSVTGAVGAASLTATGALAGSTLTTTGDATVASAGGTLRIGAATGAGVIRGIGTSGIVTFGDTLTDNTTKAARVGTFPFANAQVPAAVYVASSQAAANALLIGGGSSLLQAATTLTFFTTETVNTLTGTARWNIAGTGMLTPSANNAYDVGSSALRVRTVYAVDVNASGTVTAGTLISNGTLRVGVGASGDGAVRVVGNNGLVIIDHSATDNTDKIARVGTSARVNAQIPVAAITTSAEAATNRVRFGGGTSLMQAATRIELLTAAAVNTPSGTIRWVVDGDGVLTPGAHNTYDIGSSAVRVKTVYAMTAEFSTAMTLAGTLTVNSAATFNSDFTVSRVGAAANANFIIAKDDANVSTLAFRSGGSASANSRWIVQHNNSTTNNLNILRRNATGGGVDTPFSIDWATGVVTILSATITNATVTALTTSGITSASGGEVLRMSSAFGHIRHDKTGADNSTPYRFYVDGIHYWGLSCRSNEDFAVARHSAVDGSFVDLPLSVAHATGLLNVSHAMHISATDVIADAHANAGQLLVGAAGLAGAENRGITIRAGATGAARLAFGSNATAALGQVAYFNSSNEFVFLVNAAAVGRLSSTALRPEANDGLALGTSSARFSTLHASSVTLAGGVTVSTGAGAPEGVVTAPVGSMFLRNDGGAGSTLYVKESGSSNTGWVAK